MAKLKRFTIDDIREWNPCYDPAKWLPETWAGNILDILEMRRVPFSDRLWCALRTDLVSEKCIYMYAVKAASSVKHLMADERSLAALSVTEQFINGKVTRQELKDAACAANAAAYAAARAACAAAAAAPAASAVYAVDAYAADCAANAAANAADAAANAEDLDHGEVLVDLLISIIKQGVETGDAILKETK